MGGDAVTAYADFLDGKTRRTLTEMFADTPYRLACTATPAPNDISESEDER